MWQEARKQEKHIKTLMVDYKKRVERRREYYERIRQDPIKFLRVYGRPAKLNVDSEVVKAAENPSNMMPWIGDSSILIDRFDVRANLEHLDTDISADIKLTPIERIENRLCMYERYRCLIHNDFAGVTETMALKQIELDEKYGDIDKKRKEEEDASKRSQEPKAAIGFTYEDSQPSGAPPPSTTTMTTMPEDSDSEGDEADSDMDIDVELDLATLGMEGRRLLALSAANYGLHATDFVRLLNADQQLETELRLAKALEEEKLQLAGRKSRRARRLLKERRAKEKLPKLITTKVGLLHGQPISRRTVYLSASSSDSGDYPSGDEEERVDRGHLRGSKPTADVRARRARAKPLLTNARGPSVMIGGMTSIGLCRRRQNYGLDAGEKMRKAGARSSSSRSNSSSSRTSDSSRRSSSSSSDDRSRSGRRHPRDSAIHHKKRPRVEYITTFGDNDDENKTVADNKYFRPTATVEASSAVSALAASVVSRVLSTKKRSPPVSDKRPLVSSSRSHIRGQSGPGPRDRSPPTSTHESRRPRRLGSRHRSGSYSSDEHTWSRGHRSPSSSSSRSRSSARGSVPPRLVSPRKSASRSPLSQRLSGTGSTHFGGDRGISPGGSPSSRLYESGGANPPRRDTPSGTNLTARKRYYRPELESDGRSSLSDDDEEDEEEEEEQEGRNSHVPGRRNREQSYSRRSDTGSFGSSSAGKMTSQSTPNVTASKITPGGTRLTPQELLKRRVQLQLTKAFIADKKAEQEKQVQLEQERQAREEGLRRQARLLKRQEEKRMREELRAAALATGNASDYSSDSSSSSADPKESEVKAKLPTSSVAKDPRETKAERPRLSANLTSGYHSRDYEYPSPDDRSRRGRYGASPDRFDSRSHRNAQPRYAGHPGGRSTWHASTFRERSPPAHRETQWSSSTSRHRPPPAPDRQYSARYGGGRSRYS